MRAVAAAQAHPTLCIERATKGTTTAAAGAAASTSAAIAPHRSAQIKRMETGGEAELEDQASEEHEEHKGGEATSEPDQPQPDASDGEGEDQEEEENEDASNAEDALSHAESSSDDDDYTGRGARQKKKKRRKVEPKSTVVSADLNAAERAHLARLRQEGEANGWSILKGVSSHMASKREASSSKRKLILRPAAPLSVCVFLLLLCVIADGSSSGSSSAAQACRGCRFSVAA